MAAAAINGGEWRQRMWHRSAMAAIIKSMANGEMTSMAKWRESGVTSGVISIGARTESIESANQRRHDENNGNGIMAAKSMASISMARRMRVARHCATSWLLRVLLKRA
jgi:hypothetical protein